MRVQRTQRIQSFNIDEFHGCSLPYRQRFGWRDDHSAVARYCLTCRGSDALGGEAELLLQLLQRRGSAEGSHSETNAPRADVAAPAKRAPLLDGDSRADSR